MPDLLLMRQGPLDVMALPAGTAAALSRLPPAARFVLRGRAEAIAVAESAFGVAIPRQACRANVAGERAALWLGPDEWLLLAPESEGPALAEALEAAMGAHPHSLVDVGHRQVGLQISGPEAAAVLNAGCPLDLDPEAFAVGKCTRTLLGKAEIVLWRTASVTFRIEVWRSFASYAWLFLEEASREFRV